MNSPEILVIIPPPLLIPKEARKSDHLIPEFVKAEKSKHFSKDFTEVLSRQCHLIDSSKLIKTSEIDGMHLEPESHDILGKEVAKYIKRYI